MQAILNLKKVVSPETAAVGYDLYTRVFMPAKISRGVCCHLEENCTGIAKKTLPDHLIR